MLDFNFKCLFPTNTWVLYSIIAFTTTTQSCTPVDNNETFKVSTTCINIGLKPHAMSPTDTLKINNLPYSGQAKESIADGNITLYTNYKNGLKDDIEFGLYKNGKKSHVKYFIENLEHGEQKTWNNEQQLIKKYSMDKGKLHGTMYSYNKKGFIMNERTFNFGTATSNTTYDALGKITGNYKIIGGRKYGMQSSKKCTSTKDVKK